MAKICLIGAGSTVFAQYILSDVLSNPDLADSEIALMDIDAERLSTSEIMARRISDTLGLKYLKISSFTDRRAALKGADFVILMMQVGGSKPATVTDFEVPKQFGLRQTITGSRRLHAAAACRHHAHVAQRPGTDRAGGAHRPARSHLSRCSP